jgi:hypothetical protein
MRAFHPPIAAGADRPVADPGGDPLWRGQGSEQQRSRSMAGANFNSLLIVLAITIVIGCFAEFISLEQQIFRDLGAKIQTLS